ncbi:Hus1-like protein [Thalictrum thalictroides]|uniref:Hus1-like protein n=1 Tax=Thalictrum thalictroides TaxID=46969 RepID=A0A7J6VNZ9_THATH|nr:Hus1-like protein [Thalictrum thalictroides]
MGRICHLFLTKDHAFFLHNLLNGDGVQSIAQFRKESLFEDYRISSQNDDRIAFTIDLGLLHRALRSSVSVCGHVTTATNRLQGYKSAVIQDVPISKPLSRVDVVELQSAIDMAQDLPQTLVQGPDLHQLQSFVDRLKHVGELLHITITQYGDLHLQLLNTLTTLGVEFRKLPVVGVQAHVPTGDQNMTAQSRTKYAMEKGEALSVQLSLKHFAKSLQCHLTKPDSAFYGITPLASCLTVIFQFFIPGTRQTDKSISLHCRLPVLDPGSA